MTTPTPRTDVQEALDLPHFQSLYPHKYKKAVHGDFARQLEQELNEAKADWKIKRDALIHKKFYFQPHPDDATKCNCAYCARDFEAIADHAAFMEMELFSLHEAKSERDTLKRERDEARRELKHHQKIHGAICLPSDVPESYSQVKTERDKLLKVVDDAVSMMGANHTNTCNIQDPSEPHCDCGYQHHYELTLESYSQLPHVKQKETK